MPRKRKPHRSGAESAKLVRAHHATDAVNWQSGMAGFGQPVALRQQRRCLYRRARFGQTSLASVGRAADARDRQLAEHSSFLVPNPLSMAGEADRSQSVRGRG
jgi:hypothetical protein